MKTIPLTQGKVTVVDDDVYEWASKFKWHAQKQRQKFYATRKTPQVNNIYLHREIVNPGAELEVDHRDGDGLNNLRDNLRPATNQQNRWASRKKKSGTSSKFRGVHKHSNRPKWNSQIYVGGERIYLGYFDSEEAAAKAYDTSAKKYFGEFASPNFP